MKTFLETTGLLLVGLLLIGFLWAIHKFPMIIVAPAILLTGGLVLWFGFGLLAAWYEETKQRFPDLGSFAAATLLAGKILAFTCAAYAFVLLVQCRGDVYCDTPRCY